LNFQNFDEDFSKKCEPVKRGFLDHNITGSYHRPPCFGGFSPIFDSNLDKIGGRF
jgi:hypothetical protein